MAKLSEILKQHAEGIRLSTPEAVAVEHLKQAGYSDEEARYQVAQHVMEKEATSLLAQKGIDHEDAVKLVKAANINVAELASFKVEQIENPTVELLKQAAEYVDALELQVLGLQAQIEKQATDYQQRIDRAENPVKLPDGFNKIASSAKFTKEDLEQLQTVSTETLEKVASIIEEPWTMGHGVGVARPKTDPFLEFLLN